MSGVQPSDSDSSFNKFSQLSNTHEINSIFEKTDTILKPPNVYR
jgi:hypothetical protein